MADPDTMGSSGPLTSDTAGAEMYATIFAFLPSSHQQGLLVAGSDDGLVHISHDDGANWTDITPKDLPTNTQVTMLAESPHEAGTIYLTAARHKMGDYAPYVYRSDDLGETWETITGGLPEDDFCRVIREDPERPGLLYLGTELGLYVSFDGGLRWQSMQGNLPVSPVYDLVVKDTDLVVATHGRSFWILDDLSRLRQLEDDTASAEAHLFAPRDTVRTPPHLFAGFWGRPGGKNYHVTIGQNATFHLDELETGHKEKRMLDAGTDIEHGVRFTWWLGSAPTGEVTLTILDADGNEIDTFSSTIPEDKLDRDGLYLTAGEGINSFLWPMQYPDGEKMVDSEFHGRPSGPLACPGQYQARLSVGSWSMTQPFRLVKDPRVTTSDDDLAEQFDLLRRIQAKLDEVVVAVNEIRAVRAQLDAWTARLERLDGAADSITKAAQLGEALGAVEGELVQAEFTSEGDSLRYREMLFEKLSSLPFVVSSADARPTTQSWQVFEKLAGQIDEQLAALATIRGGDLASFNQELGALGVDIVGP